jgi:hypothetical protein
VPNPLRTAVADRRRRRRRERFDSHPRGDSFITQITDPKVAEALMRDRHLVTDQASTTSSLACLLMADTPGREVAMWSVRGRIERGDEECPIGGER